MSDIVTRVIAARAEASDRLAGLRRIGIDEISYRKGQRYLYVTWNTSEANYSHVTRILWTAT